MVPWIIIIIIIVIVVRLCKNVAVISGCMLGYACHHESGQSYGKLPYSLWVACMPLESPLAYYNMYLFNLRIANHILIDILKRKQDSHLSFTFFFQDRNYNFPA